MLFKKNASQQYFSAALWSIKLYFKQSMSRHFIATHTYQNVCIYMYLNIKYLSMRFNFCFFDRFSSWGRPGQPISVHAASTRPWNKPCENQLNCVFYDRKLLLFDKLKICRFLEAFMNFLHAFTSDSETKKK